MKIGTFYNFKKYSNDLCNMQTYNKSTKIHTDENDERFVITDIILAIAETFYAESSLSNYQNYSPEIVTPHYW